jgi:hypothetical protein
MPQKLLSLYLRVGIGAARLAFKATARVVDAAVGAAGFTRAPGRTAPPPAPTRDTGSETEEAPYEGTAVEIPPDETVYDGTPPTPLVPAEERAKTVDDEPELVEESAEPGAEDGAGPEIEIEEPWEGYSGMKADEVIARIEDATAAELAILELYERAHRDRTSVLTAAERRHKAISGQGARS